MTAKRNTYNICGRRNYKQLCQDSSLFGFRYCGKRYIS